MSMLNMAGGAVYRSGAQGASVGASRSTSSATVSNKSAARQPKKISLQANGSKLQKRD